MELTASNRGSGEVSIVIRGGDCLLLPQVYDLPDRTDKPVSIVRPGEMCPDVGYSLVLPAGGSEVLASTILRNALPFRSGFYYLSALVEPPSGRAEVAAGSAHID